jgi:large subunit ribosomal protein L4
MKIQKFFKYNFLDINGKIVKKDKTLKLNLLENSGTYLIHKTITKHKILNHAKISSTKTRSEVRGGGAKPWKQKGTGRARAGSNRSPLWRGGGVIFGPKPKNSSFKLNKKESKLAFQTLFYNRKKNITIITSLEQFLNEPKTKNLIVKLKTLGICENQKTLIIISKNNENLVLASRNIKNLNVRLISNLGLLDLLKIDQILITEASFNRIKESYCA